MKNKADLFQGESKITKVLLTKCATDLLSWYWLCLMYTN